MGKRRMTWDEMKKEYPKQNIGIREIEYDQDDRMVSGVVVCSEKDGYTEQEILGMTVRSNREKRGSMLCKHTAPCSNFVGFAMVV